MIKRLLKIIISVHYLFFFILKKKYYKISNRPLPVFRIVLLYHSVPSSHLKKFIKQIDYIKKTTIPIPIDYKEFPDIEAKYSIITFDDAFESTIKNAIPELEKREVPSIIFIPSGFLGENPGWLNNSVHPDCNERVISISELTTECYKFTKFGSHTVNHNKLAELNELDAYYEIAESKKIIEKIINNEILYIAFPYGSYNDKTIDLCKKAGYKHAYTVEPSNPYTSLNSYNIGRITVDPSDWRIEYYLKVMGAYSWLPYFSKYKKTLRVLFKHIIKTRVDK